VAVNKDAELDLYQNYKAIYNQVFTKYNSNKSVVMEELA